MGNAAAELQAPPSNNDITFACMHCASALVVDAAAAGMTLPCQRCGKPTLIPNIPSQGARAFTEVESRLAEVRRQLKENEAQRTEITGYINQLSIQLHRWKLRLQTLEERQRELESKLSLPKPSDDPLGSSHTVSHLRSIAASISREKPR